LTEFAAIIVSFDDMCRYCSLCRWVTRTVAIFCLFYARTTTSRSSVELVCSSAASSGSVQHLPREFIAEILAFWWGNREIRLHKL